MQARPSMIVPLVLAAIAFTGCAAPGPVEVDMDSAVRGKTAFGVPVVKRVPGEPLSVTVPVRSVAVFQDPLHVEYRFLFYDASGVPLEPQMAWADMSLPKGFEMYMKGAALDATAVAWKLYIRGQQ